MTSFVKRLSLGLVAATIAFPVLAADLNTAAQTDTSAKAAVSADAKAPVAKKMKKHHKKAKTEASKDATAPAK